MSVTLLVVGIHEDDAYSMVGSVNQDEFEEIVKLQGSSPRKRITIVRDEPNSLLAKVLQRIYQ
jgi:hypothetical protein